MAVKTGSIYHILGQFTVKTEKGVRSAMQRLSEDDRHILRMFYNVRSDEKLVQLIMRRFDIKEDGLF